MKRMILIILVTQLLLLSSCGNVETIEPQTIEPDVSEVEQDTSMERTKKDWNGGELLTGYWAMISQISDEGRNMLDGFYFDENGKGWLFNNLEGSFEITSYRILDNKTTLSFINVGGEIVDWSYIIHSLSENELVFTTDGVTMPIYKRVQKIEPTSDTGTYTVTEMDGTVLDIWGW